MTDLIDRQAAIDAAYKVMERDKSGNNDVVKVMQAWVQYIERLLSSEPKPGRWIETDDGWGGTYYVCSECGCSWTLIDGTPEDNGMHYCPNCGKKMEMDGERRDDVETIH